MKRTAEKVLSIIAAVFTIISIFLSFIGLWIYNAIKSDPGFQTEFEMILLGEDPSFTSADIDVILQIFDLFGGFIWLIIVVQIIGFILAIIGIVGIWKNRNPKLAGIMFIIAGLFTGFLSLTSILFYIAGILCFTRKQEVKNEPKFVEDNYDGTMRPL